MSRYTCLITVEAQRERVSQVLVDTLKTCNFDVIYKTSDYLMAREIPGQVPFAKFAKLVTAEVLIESPPAVNQGLRLRLVAKNEELPLHTDNHCQRIFRQLTQAISACEALGLVEQVAS
ncbi:MAG: hypothetical protein IGQ88_01330 [Gloeomargaritaceae cyanobacterium C42_A2020_066]|nr:hypothetical protein [Gloeomargaritaceae cyanobacterium C42_A2020_066]